MTRYFEIINHAAERKSFTALPEDDDEYSITRHRKGEVEDYLHEMREKANIEVKELKLEKEK